MKSTHLISVRITPLAIAACLFTSAWPTAASANDDTAAAAPIAIDRCTVDEAAAIENPKIGFRSSTVAGIVVAFTNERDAPANEVRFRIRYGGNKLTFVDRGTFAPHAKLSHEFSKFSVVYEGSSVDCSVLSAVFSDGSRWDAPGQTQSPPPAR
jgi:hypothetical protein